MGSFNVSIGLAFVAGLASFLSPCVFPLVPAYISYLSGRAGSVQGSKVQEDRLRVFTHGLAFVLGFSLVFIMLGLATSALGNLLQDLREWLAKIGGIVVVIFGIHMTGIWRIPFLSVDTRSQSQPDQEGGYFSSVLMGVFFSAGWSPCVGPVLGAILTLSLSGGSVLTGGLLLTAYSAGLAIPFLLAALGMGWVTATLIKYSKVMHYAEIFMGVILIIVGVMLFLGTFERLAALGSFISINL